MDQSNLLGTHSKIIVEQASYQVRQTEQLDELMEFIIFIFGVFADPTNISPPSQMTSACHTPSSSYETHTYYPTPLSSNTGCYLPTEQPVVSFSVHKN